MSITALEWQHQPSLSAIPALQICLKSKGKSLVIVTFFHKIGKLKNFHVKCFEDFKLRNTTFFQFSDSDAKALIKERQKKDNHNLSKSSRDCDFMVTTQCVMSVVIAITL